MILVQRDLIIVYTSYQIKYCLGMHIVSIIQITVKKANFLFSRLITTAQYCLLPVGTIFLVGLTMLITSYRGRVSCLRVSRVWCQILTALLMVIFRLNSSMFSNIGSNHGKYCSTQDCRYIFLICSIELMDDSFLQTIFNRLTRKIIIFHLVILMHPQVIYLEL